MTRFLPIKAAEAAGARTEPVSTQSRVVPCAAAASPRCKELLLHAVSCNDQQCPVLHCDKMKMASCHFSKCMEVDCVICKQMEPLASYHLNSCISCECDLREDTTKPPSLPDLENMRRDIEACSTPRSKVVAGSIAISRAMAESATPATIADRIVRVRRRATATEAGSTRTIQSEDTNCFPRDTGACREDDSADDSSREIQAIPEHNSHKVVGGLCVPLKSRVLYRS